MPSEHVVTLTALIPFWIVKGAQPSGHAVLWVLYGVLVASLIVWLLAEILRRSRRDDGEGESAHDVSDRAPFETTHEGLTIVDDLTIRGYDRISRVESGGEARFSRVDAERESTPHKSAQKRRCRCSRWCGARLLRLRGTAR
jgi:hypothetical protein